jgi:hypothetical protein
MNLKHSKKSGEVEYTDAERKQFLFRTASEMRSILDRVDANQKMRHGEKNVDTVEETH